MAQTNNKENILNPLELSIQISLNGLSFCILHRDKNTITFLKHIVFEKKGIPSDILDALKHSFNSEKELQNDFSKVTVIHENELSTLVPKALFNEDNIADYLKFNSKILKSDFITFDNIELNDSVVVYVPYVNVNNYVFDMFGDFTYKHKSTVLIEQSLLLERNSESKKMVVHVSKNHFELLVVNNGKLELFNTFEYFSKEDFIYFILFTAEQLSLNPEVFELVFYGDVEKNDELYDITYKYIRNVSFGNRFDKYNFNVSPKTSYSDFALIKNF